MTNWKKIHPNFTPKLQKEWEDRDFDYEVCKSWIKFGGCQPQEAELVDYLYKLKKHGNI